MLGHWKQFPYSGMLVRVFQSSKTSGSFWMIVVEMQEQVLFGVGQKREFVSCTGWMPNYLVSCPAKIHSRRGLWFVRLLELRELGYNLYYRLRSSMRNQFCRLDNCLWDWQQRCRSFCVMGKGYSASALEVVDVSDDNTSHLPVRISTKIASARKGRSQTCC
jgi:hypothetical protein